MRQQLTGSTPGDPLALRNHPTQSRIAIDRWKAFFFGLLFIAPGAYIIIATLCSQTARGGSPDWLIYLIGSFFLLAGVFVSTHGVIGLIRREIYKRQIAANPGQPWLADHHWKREGVSFSAFDSMMARLLAAIGWYAFLIPFVWVGLTQHGMARVFLAGATLFALLGLFFWSRWLQMLVELLRYGNSFLAYDSFPYFAGSTLQARLQASRHIEKLDKLIVTLRCVEERYETHGTGEDRSTSVVCYELYKDSVTFSQEQLAGAASSYLPVSFALPSNQPTTRLCQTPPVYWEIEARGIAAGANYEAYFLVPVYSATGS